MNIQEKDDGERMEKWDKKKQFSHLSFTQRRKKRLTLNKWPKIVFRKDSIAEQNCHNEVYPWVTKRWHCQSTDSTTPALLVLMIIRVQNSILEFSFSSWCFWVEVFVLLLACFISLKFNLFINDGPFLLILFISQG